MGARFVLLMLFNIAAVFLCVVATLQIYAPMSRASQALGVVLMVLTTLPIVWIMWVSPHPESTVVGIVLLNAPLWAYCIEWLLQRFVDRRSSNGGRSGIEATPGATACPGQIARRQESTTPGPGDRNRLTSGPAAW